MNRQNEGKYHQQAGKASDMSKLVNQYVEHQWELLPALLEVVHANENPKRLAAIVHEIFTDEDSLKLIAELKKLQGK